MVGNWKGFVFIFTVWKFRRLTVQSSVWTERKYLTVPCERSVWSSRAFTKIWSRRLSTTSRRGIKQLAISFGRTIFLLFSFESSRGNPPLPPHLLMTALRSSFSVSRTFVRYCVNLALMIHINSIRLFSYNHWFWYVHYFISGRCNS